MLALLFLFLFISCAHAHEYLQPQENLMIFFDTQQNGIERIELLEKTLYGQCVQKMPICCVDIFVYNPTTKNYFLVLRNVPPVQGIFWVPGGRLYKGESFFECAKRKCLEEAGLEIEPVKIIDVYNTIYPDSAWNCQTHTVNIAVFALCSGNQASLDKNHIDYKWQSIDEIPDHSYVKDIYYKAISYIHQMR